MSVIGLTTLVATQIVCATTVALAAANAARRDPGGGIGAVAAVRHREGARLAARDRQRGVRNREGPGRAGQEGGDAEDCRRRARMTRRVRPELVHHRRPLTAASGPATRGKRLLGMSGLRGRRSSTVMLDHHRLYMR